MASHNQKVILHLMSIVLAGEMQWFHWWCHQHHVMLTLLQWHHMTKKVILYLITVALTYKMQWCHWWCCRHYLVRETMVLHDQKRCVAYHFICLYLRKTMMPFLMLLGSCDTDKDPIDIWHQHQWHNMMPVAIVSHDQKPRLHLILIAFTWWI